MHENKSKIEISVLLPVFNPNFSFFYEAIQSIKSQSFGDFEVIVLYEPGQADCINEVREYLKSLHDDRFLLEIVPEKSGISKSLNLGLDRARGKYIARMDSDDISLPDRFYKQYEYMENNPDIDILGGVIQIVGLNSELNKRKMFNDIPSKELRPIRMLFENAGIAHPTAFFRKSSFEKAGLKYRENLRGGEDYRLWVDSVLAELKIDSLRDVVLYYRVSNEQASVRMYDEMLKCNEETKLALWENFFNPEEKECELIASFGRPIEISCSAKTMSQYFRKVIGYNKAKHIYAVELFNKEIVWQWLRYGIYQARRHKNFEMLLDKFTMRVFAPQTLLYSLKWIVMTMRSK